MAAVAEPEAGLIGERTKVTPGAYKARGGPPGSARPDPLTGRQAVQGAAGRALGPRANGSDVPGPGRLRTRPRRSAPRRGMRRAGRAAGARGGTRAGRRPATF